MTEPTPKRPKGREVPPLKESLRAGASKFAQMAVRDHLEGDGARFFVHAGTALEHLLKFYLASIDPVLVAEGKDFDSLLHACGRGRHADVPFTRMKTITTDEALKRCSQILPMLKNDSGDLALLVAARNGAIHAGLVAKEDEESSYVALLKTSRLLLGESGWEEAAFWGDLQEVVDTRLNESLEAATLKVNEAMAGARLRFKEKYWHLEGESRSVVIRALEASYSPEKYDEQLIHCPACETLALVSGSHEVTWEADWESGDFGVPYVSGVYPVVTFFPGHLYCRACELELDGEDEIKAAEIEPSWQLGDVDYRDFAEDWE